MKNAIDSFSGLAKYEGKENETFLRVAPYEGGYLIDICNNSWQFIKVTPERWEILNSCDVKFIRNNNMQALPIPEHNGDINLLWNFINIHEDDRIYFLAWMLECFRSDTPFIIAEFIGSQGTSKSTSQKFARQLIDPNNVNLRAAPKRNEDIFVGAKNNWIVNYNNLSHLSSQMQDSLCTLSTGGGFASRKLYTNIDESAYETTRPVLLNGISTIVTAQDLIDRCINFELPEILNYKEETCLKKLFNEQKSIIMGGILDLFSKTLKKLPNIKIDRLPRMADFTRLGEAMVQVLDYKERFFVDGYKNKRKQAVINALDGSNVAYAAQQFMKNEPYGFRDRLVSDLLDELSRYKRDGETWVKSPRGLGDKLRRHASGLKAVGIKVTFHGRKRNGVHVSLEYTNSLEENNSFSEHTQSSQHTSLSNQKNQDENSDEKFDMDELFGIK